MFDFKIPHKIKITVQTRGLYVIPDKDNGPKRVSVTNLGYTLVIVRGWHFG